MLQRRIFTGPARITLECVVCSLGLMLLASGCGRRTTARLPAPPAPAPAKIGSTETGIASWYGVPYHGRPAASGEIFDMEKLTAAHRTLPFQTWVEITNLSNGRQVNVRITDRGPFVRGRIVDLSMAAARQIDMVRVGTARVRLRVIDTSVSEPPISAAPLTALPVSAKEPPVKPLVSPPAGTGGYAVQVGAFLDPSRAQAMRDSLGNLDARVVDPVIDPGVERERDRPLWRVLVGHALSIQAATALATDVRKVTSQAVVVKE